MPEWLPKGVPEPRWKHWPFAIQPPTNTCAPKNATCAVDFAPTPGNLATGETATRVSKPSNG